MKPSFVLVFLMSLAAVRAEIDSGATLLRLAKSQVRVEMRLKCDDSGVQPCAGGIGTRCPNCGEFHGGDTEELLDAQRPVEMAGWLVAPDTVVMADPVLDQRFFDGYEVCFNGKRTGATEKRIFVEQGALALTLAGPLEGAEPLEFDASLAPAHIAVASDSNASWSLSLKPFSPVWSLDERLGFVHDVSETGVLLSKDGKPVALAFPSRTKAPNGASTFALSSVTAAQAAAIAENAKGLAGNGLYLATLQFRSPRNSSGDRFGLLRRFRSFGAESESDVVRYAVAFAFEGEPSRVIIPIVLAKAATARLEKITVDTPDGPVEARFESSLRDVGVVTATVQPGTTLRTIAVFPADVRSLLYHPAMVLDVKTAGGSLAAATFRNRIDGVERSFRSYCTIGAVGGGEAPSSYVFDIVGRLVAVPLRKRSSPGEGYDELLMLAAKDVRALVADPEQRDPQNVPRTAEEENVVAWLGTGLQELTPDLAAANGALKFVQGGGDYGAIVTSVQPGSPAAKAGLKEDDVLLRLHSETLPKPFEIDCSDDVYDSFDGEFPWEILDRVPEHLFGEIPCPWPSTQDSLTHAMTELGIGTKCTIEFVRAGELKRVDVIIERAPETFQTAQRKKVDGLGVSVVPVTYEVAQYLQRKQDDPGVVIATVDAGSPASVAGVKPYELITYVGENPVASPDALLEQLKGSTDVRLTVRRMNRDRIVTVRLRAKSGEGADGH